MSSADCPIHPEGYTEVPKDKGGMRESFDSNTGIFTAVRIFRGDWEKRFNFIFAFLPTVTSDSDNNVISVPGAVYPDFPSAVAFKAEIKGCLIAGHEGEDGSLSYTRAEIHVHYATQVFGIGPGQGGGSDPDLPNPELLSEEFDTSYEMITIPAVDAEYFQSSSGLWIQTEPGKPPRHIVVPIINYSITQTHVPKPNWKAMRSNLGKVNESYFFFPDGDVLGLTYGPANGIPGSPITGSNPLVPAFDPTERGTLRYDGPSGFRKYTLAGKLAWQISHKMAYNRFGWNNYLATGLGEWVPVRLRDGSNLYEESNTLNAIFYNDNPVPPPPPSPTG